MQNSFQFQVRIWEKTEWTVLRRWRSPTKGRWHVIFEPTEQQSRRWIITYAIIHNARFILMSICFYFSAVLDQSDNIEVQLNRELNSVAVDWKGLRSSTACACKTPFDQFTRKSNCWRCGDVFCSRCINNTIALPGHDSNNPVSVCRNCYRIVQQNSP